MNIGPPHGTGYYPFAKLDDLKAHAIARGIDLIDFGMGDPREPTPALIRQAMIDGIDEVSSYPRAAGLPALRQAISRWISRRYGAGISEGQIMPTLGAKEIIHSLAAYTLNENRDLVVAPDPAYPVYDRGARFHGAQVFHVALREENGFLPDLDAVPDEVWQRTSLFWVNYPNNPTGYTAPLSFYEKASQLARRHGFVLASDEAYSELWFDEPPVSALQLDDLENVVVVNTLSKRSCMTGYRSGFIAGDDRIIKSLVRYRPSVGVTPQDFVQKASIVAWDDDAHVEEFRQAWKLKREVMLGCLSSKGIVPGNDATFYLWFPVPEPYRSESFAEMLLEGGIVVSPGTFFGTAGEGYVRMALVPTLDECIKAADRIDSLL